MGLQLRTVPMQQGQVWLRQGVRAYLRRPLGLVGLLLGYSAMVLALWIVPLVGPVLVVASWPMLSLAFMLAAPEVLQGQPVRLKHLWAVWREPPKQRRTMLLLCAGFALGMVLIVLFAVWMGGEALIAALRPLGKSPPSMQELVAIQNDPAVVSTQAWISSLASLLSIPYWHALALVHWGGQSAGQALFSSTVALWRTRAAFMVYSLSWIGITLLGSLVTGLLSALLSALLGAPALALVLGMSLMLALSAAFYTSLWFMFADTFGVETPAES